MTTSNQPVPRSEEEAAKQAVLKHIQGRFPNMSDDMAGLYARLIEAEKREGSRGEVSQGLQDAMEKARIDFKATLDAKTPKDLPEKKRALQDLLANFAAKPNADELEELAAYFNKNRENIPQEHHEEIYNWAEDAWEVIFRQRPALIPILLNTLGTNPGGIPIVNFDNFIENSLTGLIEQGKLQNAQQWSVTINRCKANGFRGESYLGNFQLLDYFPESMQTGYRKCLEANDGMAALTYLTEAEKSGVTLTEKDIETQLDIAALKRGEIPFAA
ncbi:hypothetical protein JXD20_00865 [Candidatus Peregrinibacteria bacterium]|nr:hypothetical protein [Candidatus Peregrinibacteria bacterium]